MGRSIGDIMDDQGWIGHLKREGVASVDMVQEFYTALLDVVDLDAPGWTVTVHEVTFQLSADILAAFMGMQRPIRAFLAVEMGNKPHTEDIFLLLRPVWELLSVLVVEREIILELSKLWTVWDYNIYNNNVALMERGLRDEVIAMQNELTSVIAHVSQLYHSLSTVSIQVRTFIKRVDNVEEQLEHVRDAIGQDLKEPSHRHDSD
ncbi:hypothetical protein CJ030_MR6G011348 [Morella rubra]|uniref:Uncharacterized protein n=1 Tax=Morella rubra TaxID=262757 RepID=A0A6A1VD31_9ROSI|nr:hypothetical protein CJ030_MR6G011348 [Morella rubra]